MDKGYQAMKIRIRCWGALLFLVLTSSSALGQGGAASPSCPPSLDRTDLITLQLDSAVIACTGGTILHLLELSLARRVDEAKVAEYAFILASRLSRSATDAPSDSSRLHAIMQYALFAYNHGNRQAGLFVHSSAFGLYHLARARSNASQDCADVRATAHYFQIADEFAYPSYQPADAEQWIRWRREVESLVQRHCPR